MQRKFLPKEETTNAPAVLKNPWGLRFIESQKREETAKIRLVAFHYAGGSSSAFRLWDRELGSDIALVAVELPGHAGRFAEPMLTDIHEIAKEVAKNLVQFLDRPFFVFGHSAGSIIAFETIKIWAKPPYNVAPLCFFASGDRAPHFPRLDAHESPSHTVNNNEEFDKIITRRYQDPTLETVKKNYPDLLESLRKCIRGDMTAYERYKLRDHTPLPCPIRAFAGDNDIRLIEFPEYLDEWQQYASKQTSDPPALIPGGHFYFNTDAKPVVSRILREMKPFL